MRTIGFGRPTAARLREVLREQAAEALTYPDAGATGAEGPPGGYRWGRSTAEVARGRPAFERLGDAILGWDLHRRSGFEVVAAASAAAPDVAVVTALPVPGTFALACCRVVYTVDEPDRRGFAYGTLPRHPISGEEAFLVTLLPDDAVRFEVRQFSRPGSRVGRVAAPLLRAAQAVGSRRYLAAAAALARDGERDGREA